MFVACTSCCLWTKISHKIVHEVSESFNSFTSCFNQICSLVIGSDVSSCTCVACVEKLITFVDWVKKVCSARPHRHHRRIKQTKSYNVSNFRTKF